MSYYEGKIKVVGTDKMCFPADPNTLEALSTGCYDAYVYSDPEVGPIETISHGEWLTRKDKMRRAKGLP